MRAVWLGAVVRKGGRKEGKRMETVISRETGEHSLRDQTSGNMEDPAV